AKTQRHCRPTEGQAEEPQHKNRRWESRDDRKQREERGGDSQGRDAQPERRDNAPPSLLLPLENISLLFAGGRPGRIPHRSPLALPRPSIEAAPQSIRSRWPPAAEPSRGGARSGNRVLLHPKLSLEHLREIKQIKARSSLLADSAVKLLLTRNKSLPESS